MAAPVATVRVLPTGRKMPDGFKSEMIFQNNPGISLWERNVKLPGFDGGALIDTSTMLNLVVRTGSPRHLKTITEPQGTFAYDPKALPAIFAMVNQEQSITVLIPDGSVFAFFGSLIKFDPQEYKEGEFPLATCTIGVTNWDPVNFVEALYLFIAGS